MITRISMMNAPAYVWCENSAESPIKKKENPKSKRIHKFPENGKKNKNGKKLQSSENKESNKMEKSSEFRKMKNEIDIS